MYEAFAAYLVTVLVAVFSILYFYWPVSVTSVHIKPQEIIFISTHLAVRLQQFMKLRLAITTCRQCGGNVAYTYWRILAKTRHCNYIYMITWSCKWHDPHVHLLCGLQFPKLSGLVSPPPPFSSRLPLPTVDPLSFVLWPSPIGNTWEYLESLLPLRMCYAPLPATINSHEISEQDLSLRQC